MILRFTGYLLAHFPKQQTIYVPNMSLIMILLLMIWLGKTEMFGSLKLDFDFGLKCPVQPSS